MEIGTDLEDSRSPSVTSTGWECRVQRSEAKLVVLEMGAGDKSYLCLGKAQCVFSLQRKEP